MGAKNKSIEVVGRTGEFFPPATRRIFALVPGGKRNAYLWVGNDDEGNRASFVTLRGAALRKLAKAILKEVGE